MARRPDLSARNRANATHGHTRAGKSSRTFISWKSMMQRAHSGTCKDAAKYLNSGITVCERWLDFAAFLADMGERPVGFTLDRIDGAKGYEPSNCRWASLSEQARNRRSSHRITAFGRTLHITEWATERGMSHQALKHRIRAGWTIEDALTVPVDHRNRNRSVNP